MSETNMPQLGDISANPQEVKPRSAGDTPQTPKASVAVSYVPNDEDFMTLLNYKCRRLEIGANNPAEISIDESNQLIAEISGHEAVVSKQWYFMGKVISTKHNNVGAFYLIWPWIMIGTDPRHDEIMAAIQKLPDNLRALLHNISSADIFVSNDLMTIEVILVNLSHLLGGDIYFSKDPDIAAHNYFIINSQKQQTPQDSTK